MQTNGDTMNYRRHEVLPGETLVTDTGHVHGPTATPWPYAIGAPHHPGLYGRYVVVDLTDNNRLAFHDRYPDDEMPDLGFGVCRHGFGLQRLPGYKTQEEAERLAIALNRCSQPE